MSDLERLQKAFDQFRAIGFWARMGQRDGVRAVPEDIIYGAKRFVLWHENETESAFDDDENLRAPLHLRHFERDSLTIQSVLNGFGLSTDMDPHKHTIVVTPDGAPLTTAQISHAQRSVYLEVLTEQGPTAIYATLQMGKSGIGWLILDQYDGRIRMALSDDDVARWFACGLLHDVDEDDEVIREVEGETIDGA